MPSFKWLFRLGILLSFAWIAFGQSQPSEVAGTGTPGTAKDAIDSVVTKLSGSLATLRDKAAPQIVAELRKRGIPVSEDGPPINLSTLSALAQSAISGADGQSTTNLQQNGSATLQSLLNKVSQMDGQQVISQLQSKAQRLIQETGSPTAQRERGTDQD
jgi:hypothetical protein